MKYIKSLLSLIVLLASSTAFAAEDKPFLDFAGNAKNIQEYLVSDKWTLVMIWRHDCHVCNQEVVGYSFFHDGNERTNVLGLSMDGMAKKAKAENFIDSHDLSFPNLIGEPGEVMKYYQMQSGARFIGTPSFLLFSPDGTLMAAQAGAVQPEVIRKFIDSKTSEIKTD